MKDKNKNDKVNYQNLNELIHNEKGSGTMFDLSGRRVQIPKRGLLIIDGKKKLVQ